jgi:hypothetical protein
LAEFEWRFAIVRFAEKRDIAGFAFGVSQVPTGGIGDGA